MNINDVKHLLQYIFDKLTKINELMDCDIISEYSTEFIYIANDNTRYWIATDLDDDEFSFFLSEINYKPDFYSITYNKDTMKLGWTDDCDNDVEIKISNLLHPDSFFQLTLVNDFGSSDIQYWKDCIELMDKIKEIY